MQDFLLLKLSRLLATKNQNLFGTVNKDENHDAPKIKVKIF